MFLRAGADHDNKEAARLLGWKREGFVILLTNKHER